MQRARSPDIDDHHIIGLRQRLKYGRDRPWLRIRTVPRLTGEHPHALPLRQLAIQRRTFRFPEWYIDCLKSQARLVFDAQQHVDASGREIAVDQCALQLALGQAPCDHRREHAGSRSPGRGREHHCITASCMRQRADRLIAVHG